MSAAVAGARTRSLHSIAPGQTARIATILFDRLRLACTQLGLQPGQRIRCRAATPDWLILETPTGRRVRLERGWARFIEIVPEVEAVPGEAAAGQVVAAAGGPEARGQRELTVA